MSHFKFTSLLLLSLFLSLSFKNVHAATCTWIACNGNWSNPANWDCGMVPGAFDDVIIDNGCSPTLNVNATVASLEVSNSSALDGTANLTVNGDLFLDDAVISTSGDVTVNNGIVDVVASSSINNLFLNSVTVNQNAPLSLGGGQMDGSTTWESNAILTLVAQFSNLGIFNLNISGITTGMSGGANFNNQGTFNQTDPAASLTLTPIISMFGTWNIEGTLFMGNLAFVGGIINIANSGDLLLNNATLNNGTAFNFTGNGKLTKSGSATLTINYAMQLNGVFDFNEGDISGSGSLTVANGGTFNYQAEAIGFSINLTLDAGATMNTSGSFFPHEFSGLLTNNGTVNQGHTLNVLSNGIVNNGNWNWSSGLLNLNNNSYFDNFGTLTASHDGTLGSNTGCSSIFSNETGASVLKNAGSGDLVFETDFLNDGQLTINSGNVRFDCPFFLQGNIINNVGTSIIVTDGGTGASTTIASGTSLQIQGSGTFTVNHPLIVNGTLDLSDGFLDGSSAITINGVMNWFNGSVSTNTTVASGASLNILGPDDKFILGTLTLNGSTTQAEGALILFPGNAINNNGDYIWQSGDIDLAISSTFNNNGNFKMQTSGSFSGSMLGAGLFNNAGLYENNLTVPAMGFSFDADFNNTGIFRQTNNQFLPFSGAFSNQAGGLISGLGFLDFAGGLTNNGTVGPGLSPGELTLTVFDNTNATLIIEIEDVSGPGSGHDNLVVFSPATLGGTLNVSHTGGPLPANSSFTVLTSFGGFGGSQFATVNFPAPASDWSIEYQSNDVVITYQAQPLPVELTFFDAKKQRNHILLQWQTTTEVNNQGFDIQTSADGKHWQRIGFVEGQGSSTAVHDYQFIDASPGPGLNYYRLRQVDFDGAYEYSMVVAVEYHEPEMIIQVFPNPFSGNQLNLHLSSEARSICLLNVHGQLISMQEVNPYIDSNYEWALPNLPAGIYWLMVNAKGKYWAKKIVKK